MKIQTKLVLILALCATLLLASCAGQSANTTNSGSGSNGPIKVGLVLPLTGEAASWGENTLAGITLKANEINANGGINGRQVELIAEDDKCSASGVSALQKLINANSVDVILGPVCSASAGPAAPIAQQQDVPMMMIAASAPDLTAVGNNIFRVYPSDSVQGEEAAKLIYNNLEVEQVAIIYVQNDWGEGIKGVFKNHYTSFGGQVGYEAGVTQTETDFRTQLLRIKELGIKTLYLPVYPNNGVAAMRQIRELGLDLQVVGGDSFGGQEFIESGFADDVLYVIGKLDAPDSFIARINQVDGFENLEVNFAAALGYDALTVVSNAIENVGTENPSLRQEIARSSTQGISSPIIEFDTVGDLTNAIFEYRVIQNEESLPYRG